MSAKTGKKMRIQFERRMQITMGLTPTFSLNAKKVNKQKSHARHNSAFSCFVPVHHTTQGEKESLKGGVQEKKKR